MKRARFAAALALFGLGIVVSSLYQLSTTVQAFALPLATVHLDEKLTIIVVLVAAVAAGLLFPKEA